MKLFQNKIIVGVICIIIAAILAFLFLPSISKSKSNTMKIYVVKHCRKNCMSDALLSRLKYGGASNEMLKVFM